MAGCVTVGLLQKPTASNCGDTRQISVWKYVPRNMKKGTVVNIPQKKHMFQSKYLMNPPDLGPTKNTKNRPFADLKCDTQTEGLGI